MKLIIRLFFLLFSQAGETQEHLYLIIFEQEPMMERMNFYISKEEVYSVGLVSHQLSFYVKKLRDFYRAMGREGKCLRSKKRKGDFKSDCSVILKRMEDKARIIDFKMNLADYNPKEDINDLVHLVEIDKKLLENRDYFLCEKFFFQNCISGNLNELIDKILDKKKGKDLTEEEDFKNMNDLLIFSEKSCQRGGCYHTVNFVSDFFFNLFCILNRLTINGYLRNPEKRKIWFSLARLLPLKFSCCYDHYKKIYSFTEQKRHSIVMTDFLKKLQQEFLSLAIPIKISPEVLKIEMYLAEETKERQEKTVEIDPIQLKVEGENILPFYILYMLFPDSQEVITDYENRKRDFVQRFKTLSREGRKSEREKKPNFYEPYLGRGLNLFYHFNHLSAPEKQYFEKNLRGIQ